MATREDPVASAPSDAAALESNGRDRLLDCALDAFATWSFEAATVRRIAAQAQVDPTLINYHFGSKLGLWKAVVDRIARQVDAIVQRFESMGDTPTMVDELVDAVCAHPLLASFLIKEVSHQTDRFDYFFRTLVAPLRDRMVPIIAQGTRDRPGAAGAELTHFTLMGAMAMAIATRSFLSDGGDDDRFRTDLQTLLRRLVT